jgi:hypothetical protein
MRNNPTESARMTPGKAVAADVGSRDARRLNP